MHIERLNEKHASLYRTLRLKALKDHPEVYGSSFEEEYAHPLEFTEHRLSNQENYTFGAFVNDQLVGMITLMTSNRNKTKHNGHIVAMYVDSNNRNQGIAKALIEKVIEQSKSLNIINLYLTVTSINHQAIKLYQSFGFIKYGIEKRELKINHVYYDSDLMALYL